jgi:hypothetical protein
MKTIREKILELRNKKQNKYSVKQLIDYFGSDSHWAVIFIVNLPMTIPAPPYAGGFSTLPTGTLALILSIQILLGYKKVELPATLEKINIDISLLKSENYKKVNDTLIWLEKYLKKRKTDIFSAFFEKVLAITIIPPSLLMMLPIIFTNWLPCVSVTLISFVYLFKDGLSIFIAVVFAWLVTFFYIILFTIFGTLFWEKRKVWSFGLIK